MNEQEIGELVKQSTLIKVVGPVSIESIRKVEFKLGIKFPKQLEQYLLKYGSIIFDDHQLYGIVENDFDSTLLDQTLEARRSYSLPKHYIVVEEPFHIWIVVLDAKTGHVYEYDFDSRKIDRSITNSFNEYLLNFLKLPERLAE